VVVGDVNIQHFAVFQMSCVTETVNMARSGDLLQWKCECCSRHPQSLIQNEQKSCPSGCQLPTCGLSVCSNISTLSLLVTGRTLVIGYLRQCAPPHHFCFYVIFSWFVSRPLQHVILDNMMRYVTVLRDDALRVACELRSSGMLRSV